MNPCELQAAIGVKKRFPQSGGWGSDGFSRFWLVIQGGERNLRRIQELIGPLFGNRVDEYAVSCASDEIADVFITDKRGHGFAESRTGIVSCENHRELAPVLAFHVQIVDTLPCGAATLECDPAFFAVGAKRRSRNGLDQAEFRGRVWREF